MIIPFVVSGTVRAQTMTGPAESEPGALFVVDVSVPVDGGAVYRLSFDPAMVQFMGLVSPTPEVQLTGDSLLEISPDKGKNGKYQVKFLPFPTASAAEFAFAAGTGPRLRVAFVAKPEEKQYHLHVLIGGILLLIVAWAVWRYQKKNPGLMSTRSLFLNFEELQKAREQFFASQPEHPKPPAPVEPSGPAPRPEEPVQALPTPASTQKMPAPETPPMSDPRAESAPPHATPGPVGERTIEMPVSAPLAARQPATTSPEIPVTPKDGIPISQGAGTAATLEMPAAVPPEKDAGAVDPSKKTVARSDISRKAPAVELPDSTVPVMPVTPTPAEPPQKTVSRSGLSKSIAPAVPPLVVKLTDASGREFEGRGVEVLIGRSKECCITMTAAEVSRRHVLIRREAEKIVVVPQTSSNLTEVNGVKIQSAAEIRSGDRLSLGGTVFTVEIAF